MPSSQAISKLIYEISYNNILVLLAITSLWTKEPKFNKLVQEISKAELFSY